MFDVLSGGGEECLFCGWVVAAEFHPEGAEDHRREPVDECSFCFEFLKSNCPF